MTPAIPPGWAPVLEKETRQPYYKKLQIFLEQERARFTVYPPDPDVFNAFYLTPFRSTRVVILGQEPYNEIGQAHGLAFSVRPGVREPLALNNIFLELKEDVGFRIPNNGFLVPWAKQGVLLLNSTLTVRANEPASHQGKGWETLTDAAIRALNDRKEPVIFVLWGNTARRKMSLITNHQHQIIIGAYPSPIAANNGFFGSRPFSSINAHLRRFNQPEIDWQIPDL
jgi:uracil-DNA glycosylase